MTAAQTKQTNKAGSTQKFTEIANIKEEIVMLTRGNACLIIETQATNFSLLSQEEQHAKVFAFASLLNSLSFPIQILIRNKRLDISGYVKSIDLELAKLTKSTTNATEEAQRLKKIQYAQQYREFVQNLITVNTVLDKTFYVVVAFSSLETGVSGVGLKGDDFFLQARAGLKTKAESMLGQLGRIGLKSRILKNDQLIKLFHDIYNENTMEVHT